MPPPPPEQQQQQQTPILFLEYWQYLENKHGKKFSSIKLENGFSEEKTWGGAGEV